MSRPRSSTPSSSTSWAAFVLKKREGYRADVAIGRMERTELEIRLEDTSFLRASEEAIECFAREINCMALVWL